MKAAILLALLFVVPGPVLADEFRDHFQAGMEYLDKGDTERAVEHLEKARRINPKVPDVYNVLGIARLQQKDGFRRAIEAFEEAVRLQPDYADAYYNLGAAYAGQGEDAERAVDYFQRAIAADARFTRAYVGLGWLHLLQKRELEEAIGYFEKAIETAPESTEGYHGLGLAYALAGKRALALKPISMLRTLNRPDLALAVEAALRGEFGDEETSEEPPKVS